MGPLKDNGTGTGRGNHSLGPVLLGHPDFLNPLPRSALDFDSFLFAKLEDYSFD